MGEFSRILTNLGLAYGLGSKEQFIEAISKYAHEKEMNDDAIREIITEIFDEVELSQRRRKAKQAYEAAEMEHVAEEGWTPHSEESTSKQSNKLDEVVSEMRALRRSIETLIDKLDPK